MRAVALRDTLQAGSVELDSINLRRDVAVFCAEEIRESVFLVNAVKITHFPIAGRNRSDELALIVIKIKMLESGARRLPDGLIRAGQKRRIINPVARSAAFKSRNVCSRFCAW
jgi:hypothetical protein